jgi:hypothetical protein
MGDHYRPKLPNLKPIATMLKEARPHRIFLLASLLIGLLTIAINPPLRG